MGLFDHLYHLDWTALYPLEYYYDDGRHIIFDKYEIDMFGGIYNKKTGRLMSYSKIDKYCMVNIRDFAGKKYNISVARAVVSTFGGKPPTTKHSTEHIECTNKDNNIVCELTWMDSIGQIKNRIRLEDNLCSCVVVRGGLEMTIKEWIKYLNNTNNHLGRKYTKRIVYDYAQNKKHGFSYKIYDDLPGETWHKVVKSENSQGHWEISDKNRIAYISKHARNVIESTRFGFTGKYPVICINGKNRRLHDVAFEAYYPDLYIAKKSHEMILHKFDDKLDFRPHMLYIGDASKNQKDSHDNGCRNGTKTARISCCSYIDGVLEKCHESQLDAEKYLKSISDKYLKSKSSAIGEALEALKDNKILVRYDRTWKFNI